MYRSNHPSPRVAAGLVVSLVLALTVSAQVKTGKSRLWQALEAGESRTIRLMGSSMSQNAKASWPGELSKQLNDKLAGTATVSESGTANGQTSTTGRFDRLPGVIDAQPDAVIIEYAFCDSRDNKGVPLDVHIDNMTGIVRALREQVPDVEIFIYETGRLSFTQEENQTNLLTYYEATRQVAADMGTYLFQTAEKFTTVRDQLVQEGRPEDWIQYVYDSHHPTQKAAVEIIVPEMLSVMEGLGSAPLEPSVALSVQSMAGRSFYVGDTVQIQWYYDPARIPSVSLQLSVDGGQSYPAALVSSLSASAFLWPIPATAGAVSTVGENAVVKVESSDGSHADITGTFTILPATDKDPLTLEPLAHDLYHVGETLELAWSKDVNRVAGVEASLSLDGGANWHALNSSAIEATTFSWPIPATLDGAAILSSQALVKIQDYDKKYESYSELFVIHGPPHIIDDADPVVEVVGTWSRDAKYKNGYNGSYLDDDREARGEKTVTYPYTAPGEGTYALYAWTPYAGTGVPDYAPATVVASDGSHAVSIRIKKRTEWQHLGDFPLNEGFRSTVTIVNDVGGGTVVADAIKWEMVSGDVSTRTARRAGKAAPWRGPAFSAACRKDFLHLRHSRGIDRVHITTSDGRAVARYAGDGDRTMRIPVTHLPAGVYVVSTGRGPAGARALVTITR